MINGLIGIKNGVKTSEFWAIVIPALIPLLHALGVGLHPDTAWMAVQAAGVVYAALRTVLKMLHIKALETVATKVDGVFSTKVAPVVESGIGAAEGAGVIHPDPNAAAPVQADVPPPAA